MTNIKDSDNIKCCKDAEMDLSYTAGQNVK